MLDIGVGRLKPDKIERCRNWFAEVMQRQDEVRETFARETMRQERAFLLTIGDDTFLIYAMDCEDRDKSREAFRSSTLRIDIEHRCVMEEVSDEQFRLESIYECAID